MSCSGAYADYSDWELFWQVEVRDSEQPIINGILDLAASDIHAALAASGACDCALADWAEKFLKKLNIIDAAALFQSSCGPHLTDAQKVAYIEWITNQLTAIRKGEMELCAGETGSETPAIGWAEQGVTEFSQAQIILNDLQRNG